MAPMPPRLRVLSVGGNAVSAFLSWRLQATNACDVTLVWKSGFENVSQYGISFKSKALGTERFKPIHVVRTPEDAGGQKAPFDYVLLCVKALPDVYDLAAVVESVVTPQHTCILVNTTNTLGVEAHLEERFPTNVVLSLVSGAEITQVGASEFEHHGSTEVWVGPANRNPTIPAAIQNDMAEALAMTLSTGQVDCQVSSNIRQQQYERMIGPIAFHPLSVLFETPSHAELVSKIGVRTMILEIIEELLSIATAQGCKFSSDFKDRTLDTMLKPTEMNSIMYQDFVAKRPMEVETYLGSSVKLGQTEGIRIPRIETIYALLHHTNILNQNRPTLMSNGSMPPPRASSSFARPPTNGVPDGMANGMVRGGRASSMGIPRRGGPTNGFSRGSNGYNMRPPTMQANPRPSFDGHDLGEEFSHVVLYDGAIPEGDVAGYDDPMQSEAALREREYMLRQRELQIREQELHMRRGNRRPPPSKRGGGGGEGFDDDDDDDDGFDPMNSRAPSMAPVDADNFDMMSVTSRRNRRAPSQSQLRKNPENSGGRGGFFAGGFRPGMARNRASARIMQDIPGLHESLMENPMMGYSSNRYGAVDRKMMSDESRAGSLTRERLSELQGAGNNAGMSGAYPTPARRTSISPAGSFNPGRRPNGRPSPPADGYMPPNGMNGMNGNGPVRPNGRPSPPGMRQPIPRHPTGQGNAVAPQQVEQYAGVSNSFPLKRPPQFQVRSLTGSASASADSGDSGASAVLDSDPSAHSSQSSLAARRRPPVPPKNTR